MAEIKTAQESVLSRWSRRKHEAESEAEAEVASVEAPAAVAGESPVDEELQEPVLTDADMPDVDSLDESSDFSPFMSPGVSDELRNLALRKLFRAPLFNIRDGLDEYDEDFTTFEKLGDIVTADMRHRAEVAERKLREAQQQEGAAEVADESEGIEEIDDSEEIDDFEDLALADDTDSPATPGEAVVTRAGQGHE